VCTGKGVALANAHSLSSSFFVGDAAKKGIARNAPTSAQRPRLPDERAAADANKLRSFFILEEYT
jgi:hypothetical protein